MNERQMQFRVGVVVFATMIVGGLLATLNDPLPTRLAAVGPVDVSHRHRGAAGARRRREHAGPQERHPDRPREIDRRQGRRRRGARRHRRPTGRCCTNQVPHIRTTRAGRRDDRLRDDAAERPAAAARRWRGYSAAWSIRNPFDSHRQAGRLASKSSPTPAERLAGRRRRSRQAGPSASTTRSATKRKKAA